MNNIAKIISEVLSGNKKLILHTDDLIKQIMPKVSANDLQEFMIFQKTIREVPITSILYAADNGSEIVQLAAKEKALHVMLDAGIEKARAEFVINILTEALGWTNQTANVEKSTQPFNKKGQSLRQGIPTNRNYKKIMYIAISICCVILIGGIGFFVNKEFLGKDTDKNNMLAQTEEQADPIETNTEKKVPEMESDLSLGGLDLGIDLNTMHDRMGPENSSKQEDKYMFYFYDGLKVGSNNNKITSLVSDNDSVSTKRGIHQGSSFDDMIKSYGTGYTQMDYQDLTLYEYSFPSLDGQEGILRFAIDKNKNTVSYISVRIPEKEAVDTKNTTDSNNNMINITYTGGKTSQLNLSQNNIKIHVGQKIHLYPGDSSGDAGMLRIMTDGNKNKMGAIIPENCLSFKGVGKSGSKGSNTEMMITANAIGEGVVTVVPNYGSWDQATKLHIQVVK